MISSLFQGLEGYKDFCPSPSMLESSLQEYQENMYPLRKLSKVLKKYWMGNMTVFQRKHFLWQGQ
jgi:hypothetical protein